MFCFRNAVRNVQDYFSNKKLKFPTISQTVPEILASDPENPSSYPRPDRRCDTSDERSEANNRIKFTKVVCSCIVLFRNAVKNVQDNDRMMLWRKPRSDERSAAKRWFTDDLRLNWSAFTDQRMDELR